MNTQPKSEQKFRSQTNENINRNKRIDPSILLASNTLSNRGTSNPLGAKKRKANQFLEQTLANQKFNQSHMMPEQMSNMLHSSFVSTNTQQNTQGSIVFQSNGFQQSVFAQSQTGSNNFKGKIVNPGLKPNLPLNSN